MKKLWITLSFLGVMFACYSQDVIVKRNGEEIRSKVIEIQEILIKYRQFDNLNGPIYTIGRSEVVMIRYQNGSVEYFDDPPSEPDGSQEDQEKRQLYENKVLSYNRLKNTGAALAIGGGLGTIGGIVLVANSDLDTDPYDDQGNLGVLLITVAIPVFVTGIVLGIIGGNKTREYEEKLHRLSAGVNPAYYLGYKVGGEHALKFGFNDLALDYLELALTKPIPYEYDSIVLQSLINETR